MNSNRMMQWKSMLWFRRPKVDVMNASLFSCLLVLYCVMGQNTCTQQNVTLHDLFIMNISCHAAFKGFMVLNHIAVHWFHGWLVA